MPKQERRPSDRDYRFDNLRALLMFLVVFCHLCEAFRPAKDNLFYLAVYSFHVPCLLFISGYFARFAPGKVLRHILLPYAVFQLLYTGLDYLLRSPDTPFVAQLSVPYWLMWYLLTLFFLYLLVPLLTTEKPGRAAVTLLVLTALAVFIGADPYASYVVSLSRTVVFLPCFFLGHYAGTCFAPGFLEGLRRRRRLLLPLLGAAALGYEALLLTQRPVPELFYGSLPYERAGTTAWLRLLFLGGSMVWMLLLFLLSPRRRLPLWSRIGQNTMPIYLLHGFLQRLAIRGRLFRGSPAANYLLALVMTGAILTLLSSKPVRKLFRALF